MGNSNFCSDLTRVKAVMLIRHAVPAARCTSPGLKNQKNPTFLPTLTFTILIEDSPIQKWGEREGETGRKKVCKSLIVRCQDTIFYILTLSPVIYLKLFAVSIHSLNSSYNTNFENWNIFKSNASPFQKQKHIRKSGFKDIWSFQCNTIQNTVDGKFENCFEKKVSFKLT